LRALRLQRASTNDARSRTNQTLRQIVLDTETTGLHAKFDDRIIEIGCVEIVNRNLTGRDFHSYFNPDRDSDPEALKVHGLTRDFLGDKPKFAEVAEALVEYLRGAEIIIHNAAFDAGFLDAEFGRLKMPALSDVAGNVIDTVRMARELQPGKRASLDSLCERYGVSNAHRTLHGALLDARLLAEVYLAMTRGQESLIMDLEQPAAIAMSAAAAVERELVVMAASAEEIALHDKLLADIDAESRGKCVWLAASRAAADGQAEPQAS
jgi:DNA polymerase-3 subunit epsilon